MEGHMQWTYTLVALYVFLFGFSAAQENAAAKAEVEASVPRDLRVTSTADSLSVSWVPPECAPRPPADSQSLLGTHSNLSTAYVVFIRPITETDSTVQYGNEKKGPREEDSGESGTTNSRIMSEGEFVKVLSDCEKLPDVDLASERTDSDSRSLDSGEYLLTPQFVQQLGTNCVKVPVFVGPSAENRDRYTITLRESGGRAVGASSIACRTYRVSVLVAHKEDGFDVTEDGHWMAWIAETSTEYKPIKAAIENFEVDEFTSRSAVVRWKIRNPECMKSLNLKWCQTQNSPGGEDTSGSSTSAQINNQDCSFTIPELEPCGKYKVTLELLNEFGSEESQSQDFYTKGETPGAVKDLRVTSKSCRKVVVEWQPPAENALCVKDYVATLKNASERKERVAPNVTFTKSILDMCRNYTVSVEARSDDLSCSPVESVDVFTFGTTDCDSAVDKLKIDDSTCDSFILSWNRPVQIDTRCVSRYEVASFPGEQTTEVAAVSGGLTTTTLKGLSPCETYNVSVVAVTPGGEKGLVKTVQGTTRVAAPGSVSDITVVSKPRELTVRWKPPTTAVKCVSSYKVSVTPGATLLPGQKIDWDVKVAPHTWMGPVRYIFRQEMAPGVDESVQTGEGLEEHVCNQQGDLECTVKDLADCTEYQVSVTPVDKNNHPGSASSVEVLSAPGPPQDGSVLEVNRTSCRLEWKIPSCDVDNIVVTCSPVSNGVQLVGIVPRAEWKQNPVVTMRHLHPNTNYSCWAQYSITDVFSTPSKSVTCHTKDHAPYAAEWFEVVNYIPTSLFVRWIDTRNDDTTQYFIHVTSIGSRENGPAYCFYDHSDPQPVRHVRDPPFSATSFSHEIVRLRPYWKYSVAIVSVDAGCYKPAEEGPCQGGWTNRTIAETNSCGLEGVTHMKIVPSALPMCEESKVRLKWNSPCPLTGPVKFYEVFLEGERKSYPAHKFQARVNSRIDATTTMRPTTESERLTSTVESETEFGTTITGEAQNFTATIAHTSTVVNEVSVSTTMRPTKYQRYVEAEPPYEYDLPPLRPGYNYNITVVAVGENLLEGKNETLQVTAPSLLPGPPSEQGMLEVELSSDRTFDPRHQARIEIPRTLFNESSGSIIYYALILAEKGFAGSAQSKCMKIHDAFWPSTNDWAAANLQERIHDYQTTPRFWNPFRGVEPRGRDPSYLVSIYLIGSDNCKQDSYSFCNGPLRPGITYSLRVRAFSENGFVDSPAIYFDTRRAALEKIWAISGGAVGGFIFMALISRFGFRLILQRRTRQGRVVSPAGGGATRPSVISRRPGCRARGLSDASHAHAHFPPPLTSKRLQELQADCVAGLAALRSEFELLAALSAQHAASTPRQVAMLPQNRFKNRYTNVLPFDCNRVLLCDPNDPTYDYINASYIKGFSGDVEYIATQGPKEETTADFWRMVFQEGAKIIIMITQLVENEKVKCHQYYPELNDHIMWGDLVVGCSMQQDFVSYTLRTIVLQQQEEHRLVQHLHFREWPDFGCPANVKQLLQFCNTMRKHASFFPGMIVVHCSAGVGRTGTLISLDILLQRLKSRRKIDVFGVVLTLREQRPLMVQTEAQYLFIYECLRAAMEDPSTLKHVKSRLSISCPR